MTLHITNTRLDDRPVTVTCDDGVITAISDPAVAPAPQPGDDVLDGTGTAAIPGLVNAHTHAAMTLFRSWAGDLQLQEWLTEHIWPAEARLTADDVYWGTRLACIEMLRSGTTQFTDMYWFPEAVARAATDAGIRATVGAPLLDVNNDAGLAGLRDSALASLDALADAGPLIRPSLTPHAQYTVSLESLEWIAATAAERDLVVHIHFCETVREIDEWMATHDERPTTVLDRLGIIGERTVLAHSCVMAPEDYALVAERGATIATNPVSNLKLASGRIFPYATAAAAGVRIGLGTDGVSSNNSLDLLADVKTLALVSKHEAGDPTVLPAEEALAIATGQRSPLLGGAPIAVGARADLALVELDRPELTPGELTANLVYAASGAVVDSTVVAGEVRMRHRHIDGVDEVLAEVRHRAARIQAGT